MSISLLKRELRANYKLTLIFMGVLTLYGTMIISMFDPALGESLELMAQSMPELFAAFGMAEAGATLLEFVSNYLYGMLLIAFPMVYIILLSGRLVARYIDRGSMAYLLATPHSRSTLIATQAAGQLLGVTVLLGYVTALCLCVSKALFPGALDIPRFLLLNLGLWGVHVFFSGVCFFCSCLFSDAKYATGLGAGLCIAFLLVQMLGQAGEKFEALRYATPLTLFAPKAIVGGEQGALLGVAVLFVLGAALLAAGAIVFCKRDIPV